MRVFCGIVLLVVCIVLVGMVAFQHLVGTSHPTVGLAHSGHTSFLDDSRAGRMFPGEVRAYHNSFLSLFTFIGLGLLVLVLGGLGLALLLTGSGSKRAKGLNGDEARIVQEIYEGLSRMEKRVETLETILLERSSKQEV